MKMHLAWIRVTAAAATIATIGGQMAAGQGQYGPYAPGPATTNPYASVAPYGVQQAQPVPATTYYPSTTYPSTPTTVQTRPTAAPTTTATGRYTPAQQPVTQQTAVQQPVAAQQPTYRTAQQPSYIPATQNRYSPAVQATQPQVQQQAAQYQAPQYQAATTQAAQYQQPQYQPPQYEAPRYQQPTSYPTYTARADNSHEGHTPPMPPQGMPPQSVETLPTPDPAISGEPMPQGYNIGSPNPTTEGIDGYYASDPGCNTGSCDYNACGAEPCMEECDAGCRWFCGVYGLYMTRDGGGDFQRLTVDVDENTTTYPYYPPADVTVLTNDVDYDWVPGYEIRFGSLFDVGGTTTAPCNTGCGDCNASCGSCCPPQTYAWEAAYWWLEDDTQWSVVRDFMPEDNMRLYGMNNFAGIEYDHDGDGSGWRPVNDYYDYQMPIEAPTPPVDGDIRVVAQRVRTNWSAQNLELNLLRLPMFCGGTCAGYDACGGCGPTCTSPFTMVGLCGFRYLRFDDAFEFASWYTQYETGDWLDPSALYYDINVDNHLMGFQLGANMNYCVACRWNFFWDTNFGIYNNYIDAYQRVYGEGVVRSINSQEAVAISSNKNDVAFLGEMRLGGAYDFSSNWRGVLAYRAIGISGVALSSDQIPADFANESQVGLINSSGGMVLHGVQAGVECRY